MKRTTYILLFMVVGIMVFSCKSSKYIYFYEDKDFRQDTNYYHLTRPKYKLVAGDILDIQFHSTMTDVAEMFRFQQAGSQNSLMQTRGSQGAFFFGYEISDSGTIRIPVIGHIKVAGLHLNEAQDLIENEAQKYVKDIICKVRLYGIKVTFVGEFEQTGTQYFYENDIHLLEALGQIPVKTAANQHTVRLVRQTEDGVMTYRIDLTDREVVQSDVFYLQPNDIVYAEPRPLEIFRKGWSDYSFLVSTITSTLTLIVLLTTTQF